MTYPNKNDILPFWDQNVTVRFAGDNNDNRRVVYYFPKDGGRHELTQYGRYLMENHLGRYLTDKEVIDHIDRDKRNDTLENIRVVDRSTSSKEDCRHVQNVLITCVLPGCGKQTYKAARNLAHNSKLGKAGPFCSKSCAGKYGTLVQNDRVKPFEAQPTVPVDDRKYLQINKDTGELPEAIVPAQVSAHIAAEVDIVCVICEKTARKKFAWLNGNARLGKAGPFCGQSCASKYTRGLQTGKFQKLPAQRFYHIDDIVKE